MVSVNNLMTGEAELTMKYQGEEVHLTYNPNAYTPEIEAEWDKMSRGTWQGPVVTDFICRLVTKWDVKGDWVPDDPDKPDGDGKMVESDMMYPLVYEKVAKLPIIFLGSMVEQITEDSQQGR